MVNTKAFWENGNQKALWENVRKVTIPVGDVQPQ